MFWIFNETYSSHLIYYSLHVTTVSHSVSNIGISNFLVFVFLTELSLVKGSLVKGIRYEEGEEILSSESVVFSYDVSTYILLSLFSCFYSNLW